MTELKDLFDCKTCGAVVKSRSLHAAWHDQVEQIETTAESAETTADHVANILHQRGID